MEIRYTIHLLRRRVRAASPELEVPVLARLGNA